MLPRYHIFCTPGRIPSFFGEKSWLRELEDPCKILVICAEPKKKIKRMQQPCSRWWVWWPSPAVDCKPLHPLAPPPRKSIIRNIHKNSSARAGPDLTSGSIDYCRPSSLQPSRRPFQFSLPVPARFLYFNDFLSVWLNMIRYLNQEPEFLDDLCSWSLDEERWPACGGELLLLMRATFYKVVNGCPQKDNIPGHMLAILAHDQLQGVLMLLKSCS